MKISIIGGGPAGLYFALLMKKRNPADEITIMERNGPDDTFGWGVVFSDKTLSYLKENDEASYAEITDSFEMWDNVDVVHRDQKITIRGNRFSGIARIELLHILQKRCEALGVGLRFRTEVADLKSLADYDLLVGADGINSTVRQAYADFFRPSLSVRKNKYIWYGTNQLFHGLTLTFRENESGVFAAHSYKFNKRTSTFIVECDQETWAGAGFERMTDEETRLYLAQVFANDLHGHPLLSNNSKWINFVNVKNDHWSHRNIVLLGDALHTAHFSIGSGTKLALEDAIALSRSFDESSDVEAALGRFEAARKPVIEEYQEAAYESLVWFENVKDYMGLSPLPFAYKLMTRSKKIDYENLKKRDPQFIAAYEQAGS
jgi:anthraniloyl-CoA monooxygenase